MKITFTKPVKYRGVIYPSNTLFEIDEKEKDELMQCGGVICDERENKLDKPTKKAKGGGKNDNNGDSEIET